MALVTGTLIDFGLEPMDGYAPEIVFHPSTPGLSGIAILASKPVEVTPAANGYFEVDLTPTAEVSPPMQYTIQLRWLELPTRKVRSEILPWKLEVPEAGGFLADLLRVPSNPALAWTGEEPPANPTPGSWWLKPSSGELYEYATDGWSTKANLRGPAGYNAPDAATTDDAFNKLIRQDSGPTLTGAAVTESVARAFGWAIITDKAWAGGAKTDGTDAQPAIMAALAGPRKTVYIPPGTYTINAAVNITAYPGKRIVGAGPTSILQPATTVATAAILGTSSGVADVRLEQFKLDMGWVAGRTAINAVQITNGNRIHIEALHVLNSGAAGILLQGLNAGGGTPDSTVTRCHIDGTGLADGSTGFGIQIKDNSPRCTVTDNRVKNIKGGMGIGMNGSAGTGFPQYCMIARNHGTMAPSTIGFEFIGITAGCNHNVIANNITDQSYDNGLSISGNYNAVVGNIVRTCWNHGIGVAGSGNTITGNIVRNCGRQDALQYGGVAIDTGAYNTVVGNHIFDDGADASPYGMSFQVKFVASGGNNQAGPNSGTGWKVAQTTPVNSGRVPSDAVIEVVGGVYRYFTIGLDAPAGQPRLIRFTTAGVSRWTVMANETAEGGANAGSNFSIRAYDDAGVSMGDALRIQRDNRIVSSPSGAFQHKTKAGAPTDADFATAPADGTTVVDTTNHRLYVRSGGAWKYTQLA